MEKSECIENLFLKIMQMNGVPEVQLFLVCDFKQVTNFENV